mmetsp:Transcript_12697/g.32566  ORF Transcript_12697/g.32566 Transcript_12697/m.32566 type:complete len:276 (-) Transcript_12697:425-1252(-)
MLTNFRSISSIRHKALHHARTSQVLLHLFGAGELVHDRGALERVAGLQQLAAGPFHLSRVVVRGVASPQVANGHPFPSDPQRAVLHLPLSRDLCEGAANCAHAVRLPQVGLQPLLVVRVALAWLHHHQHHPVAPIQGGSLRQCGWQRLERFIVWQLPRGPATRQPACGVGVHLADQIAETAKGGGNGVELHLQHAAGRIIQHVVRAVDGQHPLGRRRWELLAQLQQLPRELVILPRGCQGSLQVGRVPRHGVDHAVERARHCASPEKLLPREGHR